MQISEHWIKFSIEGREWIVHLPEGYIFGDKKVKHKGGKAGMIGINKHGKPRWFRAKRTHSDHVDLKPKNYTPRIGIEKIPIEREDYKEILEEVRREVR